MKSSTLCAEVVEAVLRVGVREVVLAAGSRNAPLIAQFCAVDGLRVYHHLDERCAAFFALGRAKQTGLPVTICVTSGTAVAELLPAAIEAWYSGIPLILVTADRPRQYRGTGAPQSIEQADIFRGYVSAAWDIAEKVSFDMAQWDGIFPCHLNVCLEEGINEITPLALGERGMGGHPAAPSLESVRAVSAFLGRHGRLLVLLGELGNEERVAVRHFCRKLAAPVYAEPLSGLREDPVLTDLCLTAGERLLMKSDFTGVLRLGGVPTLRFWRDLEKRSDIEVLSVSRLPFSGSPGGRHVRGSLPLLLPEAILTNLERTTWGELMARDATRAAELTRLMAQFPGSEVGLFHPLSKQIPTGSLVYLGNSLPIREWDLGAERSFRNLRFTANRGANGIDGQVASFIGSIPDGGEGWGILGDLTALYDSTALALLEGRPDIRCRIVIVNNGGGRIFERVANTRRLLSDDRARAVLEGRHQADFSAWASLWGVPYRKMTDLSDPLHDLPGSVVIELVPDAEQTAAFWTAYDRLWEAE
jgi:2-succinyl-5-enolpyruvyl-6-hydroxy-3-cyclohexene-1-carboxylate synthase